MSKTRVEQMMQIHQEVAKSIVNASKINEREGRRKAVVLGSNYLMFESAQGTKLKIAQPTEADNTTFRISLQIWQMLRERGINTKVAIVPADFMKGAEAGELAKLREEYDLPQSFRSMLLAEYGVPKDEYFVRLESSYRRKALDILKRRLLNGASGLKICEDTVGDKTTLLIREDNLPQIPIGSRIEMDDGSTITIPLCQTILTTVYHRLIEEGATDFFGIVRDDERVCVNQGTMLARRMEILKLNATIAAIKIHSADDIGATKMEIVGLENYFLA